MRWTAPLLSLMMVTLSLPVHAQLTPGGPSGDFRVNDRSGAAPTAGPAGGPSPSPGPTMFRDTLGSKSPDEILKSIDKDLGRSTLERSGTGSPSLNLERELKSPADRLK